MLCVEGTDPKIGTSFSIGHIHEDGEQQEERQTHGPQLEGSTVPIEKHDETHELRAATGQIQLCLVFKKTLLMEALMST